MSHILRTSTEYITAPLADEGNHAYCQSRGAQNILNTYNLWKLALRGHLNNTDSRTRDRTRNFLSQEQCRNRSATAPQPGNTGLRIQRLNNCTITAINILLIWFFLCVHLMINTDRVMLFYVIIKKHFHANVWK